MVLEPPRGEVEVGEATIEFLLEGTGDSVVLIPGGGATHTSKRVLTFRLPWM
jgi:hypothetical protein